MIKNLKLVLATIIAVAIAYPLLILAKALDWLKRMTDKMLGKVVRLTQKLIN